MQKLKVWVVAMSVMVCVPMTALAAPGAGQTDKPSRGAARHGGPARGYSHKMKANEDAMEGAEIGKPAPDFKLTGADGKSYSLSDAKGKVVVLEWINHECPVVNRCHNAHIMQKTLGGFEGKPVVWMAIDSSYFCEDKLSAIREWQTSQKIDYPILLDADGKVGKEYGAKTTPHMFVVDQKGILAYKGAITDDPYGQNESPRNYVSDAVNALLDGKEVPRSMTKSFGCSVKYKQ